MAIFVTGATGFIGGAVAARLVADGYEVRGQARDREKAKHLTENGITPVLGNLDHAELLTREAQASEGVVNAADSDHHGAAVALLEELFGSGKPLIEEATAKANATFAFIFGSNCRVRATRARSELNWQPGVGSMLDWIRQEG